MNHNIFQHVQIIFAGRVETNNHQFGYVRHKSLTSRLVFLVNGSVVGQEKPAKATAVDVVLTTRGRLVGKMKDLPLRLHL